MEIIYRRTEQGHNTSHPSRPPRALYAHQVPHDRCLTCRTHNLSTIEAQDPDKSEHPKNMCMSSVGMRPRVKIFESLRLRESRQRATHTHTLPQHQIRLRQRAREREEREAPGLVASSDRACVAHSSARLRCTMVSANNRHMFAAYMLTHARPSTRFLWLCNSLFLSLSRLEHSSAEPSASGPPCAVAASNARMMSERPHACSPLSRLSASSLSFRPTCAQRTRSLRLLLAIQIFSPTPSRGTSFLLPRFNKKNPPNNGLEKDLCCLASSTTSLPSGLFRVCCRFLWLRGLVARAPDCAKQQVTQGVLGVVKDVARIHTTSVFAVGWARGEGFVFCH